jgi:hypothetical protein
MRRIMAMVVVAAVAGPGSAWAQPARVPDISGSWYLNNNRDSPCKIIQRRPDGRAVFINEKGSRADGTIRGDRVLVPDWGDEDGPLVGRLRADRIVWPDGSFWARGIADLSGTWFLNGDRRAPCKIIQRQGGRAVLIDQKGNRAAAVIRGDLVVVPDWGDEDGPLEGQLRGDRIVWPGGIFWSRGKADISGTWYLNGDRDSPCKITLLRDGSAVFMNEQGSRARAVIRGDRVFVRDWGEDGRGLEGRIRGDRIVWPDGSYWSR